MTDFNMNRTSLSISMVVRGKNGKASTLQTVVTSNYRFINAFASDLPDLLNEYETDLYLNEWFGRLCQAIATDKYTRLSK